MGWFDKKEKPENLEEMVRSALSTRGIPVVFSVPEGDYDPLLVVGMGDSERDSQGALKRFIGHLPEARPAYATTISIITVYMGVKRDPKKKISAMVYTPTPSRHPPAA